MTHVNQVSSVTGKDTVTAMTIWRGIRGGWERWEGIKRTKYSVCQSQHGTTLRWKCSTRRAREVINTASDITAAREIGMAVRRLLSTHHKNKWSLQTISQNKQKLQMGRKKKPSQIWCFTSAPNKTFWIIHFISTNNWKYTVHRELWTAT